MRTSRMARWLALVMGAWLSLVQSDAGLFHACATGNRTVAAFGSVAVAAVPTLGGDHAQHATDHGPGHEQHAVQVTAPTAETSSSSHHHESGDGECHCIGHCCVATPPALRAPDTFALVAVVRATTVQPGRAVHTVAAAWTDHVLPFATAPPQMIGA